MIAHLNGPVVEVGTDFLIVEAGGVGYEVFMTSHSLRRVQSGQNVKIFIFESAAMYGGSTSLYGFLSLEEKEVFLTLKENMPSTGAKKGLEHLDKASRSLPDFRRAIIDGDAAMLANVFGFTAKTAEKMIASLKDTLGKAHGTGAAGGRPETAASDPQNRTLQQALSALIALGYTPAESREALRAISQDGQVRKAGLEEIIRLALKQL